MGTLSFFVPCIYTLMQTRTQTKIKKRAGLIQSFAISPYSKNPSTLYKYSVKFSPTIPILKRRSQSPIRGLSRSGSSQLSRETEGFHDGQVSFDRVHGRSFDPSIFEHVPSLPIQDAVDSTDGTFWALDLDQVH